MLGTVTSTRDTFVTTHSHHSHEDYILKRKEGSKQIHKMSDSLRARVGIAGWLYV